MIVPEKDAIERLSSPLNLINRLRSANNNNRKNSAMDLFQPSRQGEVQEQHSGQQHGGFVNPFDKVANKLSDNTALIPTKHLNPPTIKNSSPIIEHSQEQQAPNLDTLLDNADSRIKLGIAHDTALDTLVSAVGLLKTKLDDMKPDKLPSAIMATSKVVDAIQRQRLDQAKNKQGREVHYHFYTPTQKKVDDYEVIEVG